MRPLPLFRKKKKRKLLVIGLDCAAPELVFDRWKDELPVLNRLISKGFSGPLESTIPPITVPAWASMLTSMDPGSLGLYGFRHRTDRSYEAAGIADSLSVRYPRVWYHLGKNGRRCVLHGVPQTYPVRPLNGEMVTGFLTPGVGSDFTYPHHLRDEVLSVVPDYTFDVQGFRTENRETLLKQIVDMTDGHFKLARYLLSKKSWDFFMTVEIGTDRIHHAFWHCFDTEHRKYRPGNRYENVIRDYYRRIDGRIGELIDGMDPGCAVLIVSDHGARRMEGGFCLNEWLRQKGYLVFKKEPESGKITPFHPDLVDWERTRAWGYGGYCGRIYLNVKGREPSGCLEADETEELKERISSDLSGLEVCPGTRVFRPETLYREVSGISPDLIVHFGDLFWRSVGSLGHEDLITTENDTGPDSCNHSQHGLFILYDPQNPVAGRIRDANILDVAPTILDLMGVPAPLNMQGKTLRRGG